MFDNKKIHMIGIGGISMSGIAEILLSKGCTITGSDMQEGKTINMLREKNVEIFIGEKEELVDNADIVVYTAAIKNDNKELVRAKELNKEIYERGIFLGLLTKDYVNVICISGTHGKSTTTGMVSHIFLSENLNPTIQIGAFLPKINANYYVGDNKYFIMEACEYKDSFLNFYPTNEVILNIDDDHLDYFKNMDNVLKSYQNYINLLPNNGSLVINLDDENINKLKLNKNTITYSINNKSANLYIDNLVINELGFPQYDVYYNNNLFIHLNLSITGIHNIYNSLASIGISIINNISTESIIEGIESYKGVERRFEYIGKYNNAYVYDDYAHHPAEIKSTYNSVKNIKHKRNIAIFQSHTYSRTYEHLNEFANVLKDFDNIIIAPIYPARETNIWGVKEEDLVNLIKEYNPNVTYIDSFDKIVDYLKKEVKEDDFVITIGAGPINEVANKLVEKK